MAVKLGRRPNGEFSVFSVPSKADAIGLLDELGNTAPGPTVISENSWAVESPDATPSLTRSSP